MLEREIVVTVADGLHARPAAEFVRLSAAHTGAVSVRTTQGAAVDAASILSVMMLGVDAGDRVIVAAEGVEAPALLERLAAVLDPTAGG